MTGFIPTPGRWWGVVAVACLLGACGSVSRAQGPADAGALPLEQPPVAPLPPLAPGSCPSVLAPESGMLLPTGPDPVTDLFQKGRHSVQFLVGAYNTTSLGPNVDDYTYIPFTARFGTVLTEPCHERCFRGSFELLFEVMAAPITTDEGSIFVGPSALVRYNLAPKGSRFIPYVQAGAGVVYNDVYQDMNQRAIGQAVEFMLQGGIGVRYLLTESLTLDVEVELQHISNGCLAERNQGINQGGASIGLTYFFGPCGHD